MEIYLIMINFIAFALMGFDKARARNGGWRISESTLLFAAVSGGSVGVYLGLKTFRHKTKRLIFTVGVPFIFALQIALLIWHFVM